MKAESLPPETSEIPHEETRPQKRIHVQNSASHGGYFTRPNEIESRMRKESRGACFPVFSFIWSRTASFRKFEAQIPFPDFVENISYGERSIRDALLWLEERGWIMIRRGGSRANFYGVDLQLLEDNGCLEDLPTDGGKSPEDLPADGGESPSAKIADQNSHPPKPPYKDLGSFKENTPNTPVLTTTGNGPEPEPEPRYEGCVVSQPEIPEEDPEDRHRTRFDAHAEIRQEPEPERKDEGYDVRQPEIQIPDHPVAHKLRYCRLHPRNIVKFMRQYEPDHIMKIVNNFEEDMGKPNKVEPEDYPRVLWWRLEHDVTSWDRGSWVSDVQREFDKSVKSDRGRLLGVVEYAALEQNLPVGEVVAKLQLAGISYEQMKKWAAVEMGIAL